MTHSLKLLFAVAALVLTIPSAHAECAVDNSVSPPKMRCMINLEGYTAPNAKVPVGAKATIGIGSYQGKALACRGTDFLNALLEHSRRRDSDASARALTKVYREGFCLELPITTPPMRVAISTRGAVCLEIPNVTPWPSNQFYDKSDCLFVRVRELSFQWPEVPIDLPPREVGPGDFEYRKEQR
jgi:hypothetical protein